ncbi:hypothetical protein MTO96_028837 [Rhipicephalus appendiculatus]
MKACLATHSESLNPGPWPAGRGWRVTTREEGTWGRQKSASRFAAPPGQNTFSRERPREAVDDDDHPFSPLIIAAAAGRRIRAPFSGQLTRRQDSLGWVTRCRTDRLCDVTRVTTKWSVFLSVAKRSAESRHSRRLIDDSDRSTPRARVDDEVSPSRRRRRRGERIQPRWEEEEATARPPRRRAARGPALMLALTPKKRSTTRDGRRATAAAAASQPARLPNPPHLPALACCCLQTSILDRRKKCDAAAARSSLSHCISAVVPSSASSAVSCADGVVQGQHRRGRRDAPHQPGVRESRIGAVGLR